MSGSCPLCGSGERLVSKLDKGFQLFECTACMFQFVLPRPGIDELKAVYDPPPEWSSTFHTMEEAQKTGRRFQRMISPYSSGREVLEVGCNTGFILQGLKQFGYSVCGTDLSETALAYARREYGLTDLYCSEFPPEDREETFDVVIASHIIEHVIDPPRFVTECARFLKPGGLFLVLTPNVRSVGIRTFGRHYPVFCPPIHLNYFSTRTLRRVLSGAFDVVWSETESHWADPRNTTFNALVSMSDAIGVKNRLKNADAFKATSQNGPSSPGGAMGFLRKTSHAAQLLASPLFALGDWTGAGENISLLARKK